VLFSSFSSCATVGLTVTGNSTLTAGDAAMLRCKTDMNVDTIRWITNDVIAAELNFNQVYLIFNPVFDYLHGREYICQTTASYGIAEKRITFSVKGMLISQKVDVKVVLKVTNYSFFYFSSTFIVSCFHQPNWKCNCWTDVPTVMYCSSHRRYSGLSLCCLGELYRGCNP